MALLRQAAGSAAERELTRAVRRVHEEYGSDLRGFFEAAKRASVRDVNSDVAERLRQLICLPSEDTGERHRLITVGLTTCACAACDLLIAGDYAAVYPQTLLLCHGVRRSSGGDAVTREVAADLAQSLATSNERFALETANNAISRFIFRYVMLRPVFPEVREADSMPSLSDESCFLRALLSRTSSEVGHLLSTAMLSHLATEITDLGVLRTITAASEQPQDFAQLEAVLLKCIIDRLIADHKDDDSWTFRSRGLSELQQQFEILLRSRVLGFWSSTLPPHQQDLESRIRSKPGLNAHSNTSMPLDSLIPC